MRDNDNPIKDYYPVEVPRPDPATFSIFRTGARGGLSFFPRNIIKYLGAKWVVYDNRTPRMFNGRSYEVIPDTKLDAMITDSVDSYMTDRMVTNAEFNSIIRNAEAILDFTRIPPFETAEETDNYSVIEEQKVVGGLFAFQNGILNTANGMLLPFTRHLMVRSLYQCRYDPSIKECRAERYIERILPNPDTRRFFYEMVGYILYGSLNPPAIFVIYGPGETGKSALANMISALMGDAMISRVTLNQLAGDKFMPATLEGKRLNISGETGEGKNRYNIPDGELIKQLSGGEEIMVQRKHGHPYQIHNTAKLLFLTNTIPNFGDTSSGLYRRLYTIPCRVKQDPKENIYDLMTDEDSLSWLANKSLEAYEEFKNRGCVFQTSDEMRMEWQNMRVQDPVFDFLYTFFDSTDLHDICSQIINHAEYKRTKVLYDKYREWCYANTVNPLGSRKFYEKLRNETELDIGKNPIVLRFDGVATSTRVFVWKHPSKTVRDVKPDVDTPEGEKTSQKPNTTTYDGD